MGIPIQILFLQLYRTIILNVIVRQLIKNSQLQRLFQLKSGEKYRMLHRRNVLV